MEEAAKELKEKLALEDDQIVPAVATAAAAVIGTLILCRLLCCRGRGKKKIVKKGANGKGPTGKGKAKIYHSKILRSSRVTWLIEELGIKDDFKIIEFNPFSATPDEMDWYKTEVNPHGLVPTMVLPDGSRMIESAAICMYLAETYGKMLPDPDQEIIYYNWMVHGIGAIGIHLNNVYHPIIKKTPEYRQDRAIILKSKDEIRKWLGVLEKQLEDGRTFICGAKMTAVDCVVGYTTMYASVVDNCSILTAEDFPNVASYLTRLKKRPGFINNVGAISDWP